MLSGSRRRVLTVTGLIVSLAILVALLVVRAPTKVSYALFRHCPLHNPHTDLCLFTHTVGGELVLGSRSVPLSKTITLQGGVHVVQNSEREILKDEFIPVTRGETLSKAPQAVPGGLPAVLDPSLLPAPSRKALDQLLASGGAQVTATIELAAPASAIWVNTQNLIEGRGTGLSLPLMVKLTSSFLGENCYIGSTAHPVVIALTTSAHKHLAGKPGHASFQDHYNLVTISGESLVSDSFAAPRAVGCGATLASAIDPAVNARLGLPAAAGRNQAILQLTLRDANAPAVVG